MEGNQTMKEKKGLKGHCLSIFCAVFLGLFAVISVVPLIWIIISSFKTNKEILSSAFTLPSTFSFSGYAAALDLSPIFSSYLNSIIIAVGSTLLNVLVISMAAYVLARFKFRGNTFLTLLLSVSLLIPTAALLMPIYRILKGIGLYDTKAGLIIVYAALGLPTSLFIFKSYFQSIPKEMEDAACIDGAGFYKTFFLVILPLAKPGLATGAILQFLTAWNEFMFALILTQSTSVRTLPLALNYFTSSFSFNFTAMFAALTMAVLPSILIYVFLQEQVNASMVTGAVKG